MSSNVKSAVKNIFKYRHIIFDFDGVLADTNPIRIEGFAKLFKEYPPEQVDEIIAFANANGGLSRFKKIRYFFNEIRKESLSNKELSGWAEKYSDIVKQDVINAEAVEGAVEFLTGFNECHNFALISGSEERELRDVCRQRKIDRYFVMILGSPSTKEENIHELFKRMPWQKEESVFVGDAVNDYTAAKAVGLGFIGRNSGMTDWSAYGDVYSFDDFNELIRRKE